MVSSPAYASKPLGEIANEAILSSEDIHTVLEGRSQLAAMLEEVAKQHEQSSRKNKGVISWLFGDGTDLPDHLG